MAKKKTKSKKSSFSVFLNTKKLLVFVLAFAIIGGGVYAYRSFAANKAHADKPQIAGNNVQASGSSKFRVGHYQRHCTYASLQKKVGTGSWLSVSNDTKCEDWFNVWEYTLDPKPNHCTQFRTYIKGWLDNGPGTSEHHVATDTSATLSVSC